MPLTASHRNHHPAAYLKLTRLIIVEIPHQKSGIAIRIAIQFDMSFTSTIKKDFRFIGCLEVRQRIKNCVTINQWERKIYILRGVICLKRVAPV